ncbi:hypothetical protein GLOIN_2v1768937 [Rhizophagus irregularis DAOM 181602=DAOM 197198]|uniref:Uncharacterized protein n=1 Tax=Rhizophagus irregularis (strain DAOM 181602 / DAOM 197198 / MUCL 43194) TaxID=747089 RepID=A0A2P4QFZ1_RHIID|nr:hypothetical protein GLOIN_2v1768937 [Rhizophagus irregularis DAOM 181602=DAOM 197198]POG76544.1 hypothetical protein GLOIN_2v1768937 [Rhizophagus irregularis DAOM 181602=DAOM 197198]GET61524.1 hypothetical protein GLOIN_2v1768937 [Rhizophagus irregularis DAOM 181602=DAOM 197198]|eukprot:XP_025183410.1 hypothetical protein GLOIN_2v1768937 [Rhizophagus irregularis DAOM 181602=DAOM 197198]
MDYFGLNPVVVQVLNNLQYRYSGETPEMWYSRVHYPFKKLLEYNPKYFSKNGFIQMIERSYKIVNSIPNTNGEFKAGRYSFHIYCTNVKKRVSSELSNDKIDEIYGNIYFRYRKSSEFYCSRVSKEIKKSVAYRLINSTKIPFTYNRMQITPYPGCSLHCLANDEGPLALKSVGEKLLH